MLADMFSRNYSGVAKTMISAGWVSSSTKPIELEVTIRTAIDPIFERPFSEINFGEMLLFLFEVVRTQAFCLSDNSYYMKDSWKHTFYCVGVNGTHIGEQDI